MSGFKINPSNSVNGLIKAMAQPGTQPAQQASPVQVSQTAPVQSPATLADQIKSRPLQGGQAAQTFSFVDTPARPTEAQLSFAKDIEVRAAKGEKISDVDAAKYHAIADQLEASLPVPRLKPADVPPSVRETDWAIKAESRALNDEELRAYQSIALRQLKADREEPLPGNVTRAELNWAKNLIQLKQTDGINPTERQLEIYTDIYNRSQTPVTQPQATTAELNWAGQLKASQEAGEPISEGDKQKYLEIYAKAQPLNSNRVSVSDLQWAMQLNQRASQGLAIEDVELDRYGDIQDRLMMQDPSSIQPQDKVVSQHELDWANKLVEQTRNGIPASSEDEKRYQSIYQRQVAGR